MPFRGAECEFNRLLLGSTAENVVRVAIIPVLIVRSFLVQNEIQM